MAAIPLIITRLDLDAIHLGASTIIKGKPFQFQTFHKEGIEILLHSSIPYFP